MADHEMVVSASSLSEVIPQIFEDVLHALIHDIVLETHRAEKTARMTSAAVRAEILASQASGVPATPTLGGGTKSSNGPPQGILPVPGGTYENGKVMLKGNPLENITEDWCPHCKLPRLMFPAIGVGSRLPENPHPQYCTLHPFIQKPGHDIYGNPFPIDQTNKTKRERELIKKAERAEKENTPGSQDTNEDGTAPGGEAIAKRLMAGGKPASYVPWHTCPLCKRSLLITKFAQHLEKCLGIGGRAARNTAAARLSSMNGSVSGSVQGSRVGTPVPSLLARKDAEDEEAQDDGGAGPTKKKKKETKKERERKNGAEPKEKLVLKVGKVKKAKADADNKGNKRERDEDKEPGGLSKKIKLGQSGAAAAAKRDAEEGQSS
ncbi:hypothetical protein EJ06DRAFT_200115 [Trichodelitschia bisporula]|uniref:SAGA-associated factor 11 n=1 Tax=Trichodelitschia bisporula TaxID=703511 RepID=A0A6G1I865_9PEZI|nr:hypothetical protein EJ06DRAFT_200115 [Trichodelitschia bisporula]